MRLLLEIFKLKGQKKRTEIEVSMLVEIKKRSERKRKSLVNIDRIGKTVLVV